MRIIRTILLSLGVAALLLACSDPTGPDAQREKGVIAWISASPRTSAGIPTDGDVDVIQAPDEVVAGEDFTATVTTIGADGCWKADGASVELEPQTAEVTPWDLAPNDPELACAAVLTALPREVTLRFTEPGEAVIRVLGRKVVDGDLDQATDEVVEQRVQVLASAP